jgi:hypothetical protein
MANMEKTVKSVVAKQGEFHKWMLEVEAMVLEITDTLKNIQAKVDWFNDKKTWWRIDK